MTDDECIHGLTGRSCTICIHGPSTPEKVEIVATFAAQHDGVCAAGCTFDIDPGDVICKLSNDRYVHQRCAPGYF